MENQDSTTQPSASRCQHAGRRGHRFGRGAFFLLVALAAGFVGGYAGRSFAHGPGNLMFATMDPAQIDEHMQHMVRHFAVEADATPAQQEKLTAIAQGAAHDLAPLVAKTKDARQRAFDLMGAPAVDRDAIEALRAEQIAVMDTASKRLTLALADAAEVLTPDQRKKLVERAQRFGQRFHHG